MPDAKEPATLPEGREVAVRGPVVDVAYEGAELLKLRDALVIAWDRLTDAAATAPGRMVAMEKRLDARLQAVKTIRPPLEAFVTLSDEQKARPDARPGRMGENFGRAALV